MFKFCSHISGSVAEGVSHGELRCAGCCAAACSGRTPAATAPMASAGTAPRGDGASSPPARLLSPLAVDNGIGRILPVQMEKLGNPYLNPLSLKPSCYGYCIRALQQLENQHSPFTQKSTRFLPVVGFSVRRATILQCNIAQTGQKPALLPATQRSPRGAEAALSPAAMAGGCLWLFSP